MLVLKNCKVFLGDGLKDAEIGIDGQKVVKIGKNLEGDKIKDLSGKVVIPGAIDVHVHFRDPGLTYKEDFRTGSMAAVNGGVTFVFDMPNNKPPITSLKSLEEKRINASKKTLVDFRLIAAVTSDNLDSLEKISGKTRLFKVFMSNSTGNLALDREDFPHAFSELKRLGSTVFVHCEDRDINEENKPNFDASRPQSYCESRPNTSEQKAAKELFTFQHHKVHVCHVSTYEGLNEVKNARKKGQDVSCEATPHHLFLVKSDMDRLLGRGKVNPPLRSRVDRIALWEGLQRGDIDMVATDHAPHSLEEKSDFESAPSGVPGIETSLALLLNKVNDRTLSFERFVNLVSVNPARRFGMYPYYGLIREGNIANLTVIDMKKEYRINSDDLYTKCGWSPFEGYEVKGKPVMTFVRGALKMEEGEVHD